MLKRTVYVEPHPGGWAVRREDSQRVSFVHATQSGALAVGRATAIRERTEVVVVDREGRILSKDYFGVPIDR